MKAEYKVARYIQENEKQEAQNKRQKSRGENSSPNPRGTADRVG